MVYKRVSSALFFSIVWMLLVCPKAYSQSNSMRVARIFSDNMVLQQGIYAPVWGWADSGATVRISMSEKEYETPGRNFCYPENYPGGSTHRTRIPR